MTDISQPVDTSDQLTDAEKLAQEQAPYTPDEVSGFLGDLKPGEVGYLPLGEDGEPTGAATREPPAPGEGVFARVIAPNYPRDRDELTTPTGAPIMKHMNPMPDMWDAGMLERNPIEGSTQRTDQIVTAPPPGSE